jgi:hypothetical protein
MLMVWAGGQAALASAWAMAAERPAFSSSVDWESVWAPVTAVNASAREMDGLMFRLLSDVAAQHPSVARVDGRGLHWTVELHGPDWHDWRGEDAEPLASQVAAHALQAGG